MRPDKTSYFLTLACQVAERGTCARRKVGCVLVDAHAHIKATGYNGVAAGRPHCTDHPCPGAGYPSGQGLEFCEALHAEQNALLQCEDVYAIVAAYVTASPCVTCTKLFMNTSCQEIVFLEEYPHTQARDLWEGSGRVWRSATPEERLMMMETLQSASRRIEVLTKTD
jgi:dCMP deaminase